jgi:cyclopropane fatty-acyl-phospholipid synthase-like methyltransferase
LAQGSTPVATSRCRSCEHRRRNIYAHYDIGNAFYSAWLDPTYSSALFEDHTPDLTAAQNNK